MAAHLLTPKTLIWQACPGCVLEVIESDAERSEKAAIRVSERGAARGVGTRANRDDPA